MTKRVFIIHGWGGSPDGGWMPWLKEELNTKGFKVVAPQMPNTEYPKIDEWVGFLIEKVGEPDENTYFVGHSIGCQAVLRYLEKLPKDKKVGGVLLIAGWFNLKPATMENEEDVEIAKPWIEIPIDYNKILNHTKKFTAIFSDDDPYAPVEDSELFKKRLGAKIIIEHNKGHFACEDGTTELPVALEELLKKLLNNNS